MTNLNLLFHKIYYKDIGTDDFDSAVEASNKKIFGACFVNEEDFQKCEIPDAVIIRMKTKYPGLLIGTGYPHGSGRADDDIKCGFSFDYVSGQPYIPGSSVKGVLRSHFTDHPEAVAAIIKEIITSEEEISEETVKSLAANIFDHRDVFLDAVLYDGDKSNHILGSEYITPHKDATKNPIPIYIMKVLPDVRFEFRFLVSDFVKDEFTFTGEQKKELFKTLLELFGVGAKTNVGYGILVSDDSAPRARVAQQQSAPQTENNYSGNNRGGYSNNTNNNRYKNNRGGNGYSGGNRFGTSGLEMVKCPHCGRDNYKYNQRGVKNTKCYHKSCKKDLA